MGETKLMRELQLAVSKAGGRIFRNNVGCLQDARGRWVKYGVGGNGGSDLIGFVPIKITTAMVGKTMAVFAAIECKFGKNVATKEQEKFIKMVQAHNGIGICAYSVEEALIEVANYVGELSE